MTLKLAKPSGASLKLAKPTGAKLLMRPAWQPMDADAAAYITAVETADGQALEEKTKIAIDNFVLGCKADGIWSAIKASCILAGARTLSGALVPLVGTAPTNFNFVSGDYNRKTGLVGNGSTKYLNSNRTGSADPQNSHHMATYVSAVPTLGVLMGTDSPGNRNTIYQPAAQGFALRQSSIVAVGSNVTGLMAASRTSVNNTDWRTGVLSGSYSASSVSDTFGSIFVFARNDNGSLNQLSNARLAFYSIGESLNLTLLDARVTTMINAFAAAIP